MCTLTGSEEATQGPPGRPQGLRERPERCPGPTASRLRAAPVRGKAELKPSDRAITDLHPCPCSMELTLLVLWCWFPT